MRSSPYVEHACGREEKRSFDKRSSCCRVHEQRRKSPAGRATAAAAAAPRDRDLLPREHVMNGVSVCGAPKCSSYPRLRG